MILWRNGKGWVKEGVMWQVTRMCYCTSCTHLGLWDKLGPLSSSNPAATEEGHPVLCTISALGIQVWHTQVELSILLRCLQWRKTFDITVTPKADDELISVQRLHGHDSSSISLSCCESYPIAVPRWCQHWLLWIGTCQQLRPSQLSCGSVNGLMATASLSCHAGDEGCCHCQFTAGTLFLEMEA